VAPVVSPEGESTWAAPNVSVVAAGATRTDAPVETSHFPWVRVVEFPTVIEPSLEDELTLSEP
jgi:hypothetical protein